MDSVFHFIFPLIAALGARIHLKHGIRWVLILALVAVFLDIDHFIGVPRGSLHNMFITLLLPLVLIALAFKYEKKGTKWKSLSVLAFLFLISHVVLDLFDGLGVRFLYPFSDKFYSFGEFSISTTISTGQQVYVMNQAGLGLLVFFALLSLVYFLDEVILMMQRKHESFRKAFGDAVREEEEEIKKEL